MLDERQLMSRVAWRLMPLLVLMFLVAFIDRQNVGFAKLQMVKDLGLSEAAYGLGASLFFIGYLLFEVPSTLALHRFGARTWLARIIGTWGLLTVVLAFTANGPMFYGLRFLLGVAEAGFYPGVIYYLTLWFPKAYRIRVLGIFTLGSAMGNMVGALIGGPLLDLDGVLGLAGWQWVFLVTGIPAVLLTFAALKFLPNGPQDARFLNDAEKSWLTEAVRRDTPETAKHGNPIAALWDYRVLLFALAYMMMSTSQYGVTYWMPTVVKGFGVSGTTNGLLNTIPWALATLMLLWLPGRLRRDAVVFRAVMALTGIGVLCFFASTQLPVNWMRFLALMLGVPCISLLYPCFWSLPPRFFQGARAAASIAAINSIGNLGGFFGQNLMPWVGQVTGSSIAPMLVPTACLALLGAGTVIASRYLANDRPQPAIVRKMAH